MTDTPPPTRIRTLMGWGVSGQLTYVASQFVTLLALTRFASVEEVGIYGLASAVVIPAFFFFDLNMRVNVAASGRAGYSFQDFRALLLISLCLAALLLGAIGFTFFSGTARSILLILAVTKMAESLSNLSYGVFQRFDRMGLVAASQALRSIGGTLLFVLLLVTGFDLEWAFLGQFVVWLAAALFFDHWRALALWRAHGGKEGMDPGRMKGLFGSALPLACVGLLSALQGNAPRYVIAWLLGTIALGQFTVVAYAMQAINIVVASVSQSVLSRLNSLMAQGRYSAVTSILKRLLIGLIGFISFSALVSFLVGDEIVRALFGAQYDALGFLLTVCIVAAGLRAVAVFLQTILLANRHFSLMLLTRMVSAPLMAAVCLLGAWAAELEGVAWGMCLGFVLHAIWLEKLRRSLTPHDSPASTIEPQR